MGTGQGEQRAGGEFAAVVAQAETLVTEQPGDGAFDHPAAPAEPAMGLDAAAGDAGEDAAAAQIGAAAGEVVGLVGVQLGRRRRGRPRPGRLTAGAASSSGSSSRLSWVFAADSSAARWTPAASTKRWYLEPGVPRSVGFGPVNSPPFSPAH